MKNLEIPTIEEMYMVSYLTINGWEPNYDYSAWKKEGHSQVIEIVGRDKYGYCTKKETTEWFELEQAFEEEKYKDI